MKQHEILILSIYFALIIMEIVWSFARQKTVYNFKETLSNFFIYFVGQSTKTVTIPLIYGFYNLLTPYALFDISSNVLSFILTIIIVDFLYYWNHRALHQIKILWTIHHVHHSSLWMNFTTSFRLNWFGSFISSLFYIPALLLGFSPTFVLLAFYINLIYQFFLHTEAIGQLPLIEGTINTPSAHRVHHGSNDKYIDKNYGGLLAIWDRIFGTYQPETEKVIYGVTTGFAGHNPFKAEFGPILNYLKGSFTTEAANLKKSN